MDCFSIFLRIVSLLFWNSLRLYFETLLLKFLLYGFHRKDFDGLKFICGYLITLCSIILVLIIYKIGYASKSLVWVWGVTVMVSEHRFMIL